LIAPFESVSVAGLRKLPRLISEAEAQGHPVIVTWPTAEQGPLPEHVQRLYATLGVLVRFV
jgi:hypothetical protein